MPQRMPAVFFGHGNPMNALLRNPYTEGWAAIGAGIPRPKAILCVSAHWYIEDAAVTMSTAPRTIHDFGGFPRELQVQYPAPGDLIGNLVHNLHAYAWGRHTIEPYDWAVTFESRVRELLLAKEHNPLIDYENKLGSEATLAVPTPDHYLPLLYVIGTRTPSEPVTFPVEGVDGGSISMLAVQVG